MPRLVTHFVIVDDFDDDVFFTKRALAKAGYKGVVEALSSGKEAIDRFSAIGTTVRCPDVVLLDIKMPILSGFEVLQWLQSHPISPLPVLVVMFSSSNEIKDRAKASALGAHDYAVKPADEALFSRLAAAHDLAWH